MFIFIGNIYDLRLLCTRRKYYGCLNVRLSLIKNIIHFSWCSEFLNTFKDKIQMEKCHSK